MTLQEVAQAYVDRRTPAGAYLTVPQALGCAIEAARYFNGWADIASAPEAESSDIDGATELSADELVIITPLFDLYCEREMARMLEGSRVHGAEMVGRTSSEVMGDIERAQDLLRSQAFVQPMVSIGLDD